MTSKAKAAYSGSTKFMVQDKDLCEVTLLHDVEEENPKPTVNFSLPTTHCPLPTTKFMKQNFRR